MIRSLNVLPVKAQLFLHRFYLVTFFDTITKPCFMNEHTKALFIAPKTSHTNTTAKTCVALRKKTLRYLPSPWIVEDGIHKRIIYEKVKPKLIADYRGAGLFT